MLIIDTDSDIAVHFINTKKCLERKKHDGKAMNWIEAMNII